MGSNGAKCIRSNLTANKGKVNCNFEKGNPNQINFLLESLIQYVIRETFGKCLTLRVSWRPGWKLSFLSCFTVPRKALGQLHKVCGFERAICWKRFNEMIRLYSLLPISRNFFASHCIFLPFVFSIKRLISNNYVLFMHNILKDTV